MIRRCLLALTAATLLVGTTVPAPAAAMKRDEVVLSPGQTVTMKYPALTGSNLRQARTPVACSTKAACDTIPVRLEVPEGAPAPDALVVEVSWNVKTTQTAQAVGQASDNQLFTSLWKSPPDKTPEGTDTEHARSGFVAPPQTLSMFNPTLASFVVVENAAGVNEGYTVKFTFQEQGTGPGADGSVDTGGGGGAPVDQSDDSNVAVTPSFSGGGSPSSPFAAPTGSAAFSGFAGGDAAGGAPPSLVLDILGVRGDGTLDGIQGIDEGGNFRLREAKKISATSSGPPKPQDAPGVVLAFWLVVAPLAVGGVLAGAVMRRRSTSLGLG